MSEGYIMLHRCILDWEWYKDLNTCKLFIHLLLIANHSNQKWRGIEIKRGQTITSVNSLSVATGLSIRNVRTSLNRLKSTNELTIKTTNKYSVITICKYDCYQSVSFKIDKQGDKQNDKQVTSNRQASDKQVTTNNNDNNEKNENKENKMSKLKFASPSLEEVNSFIKESCLPDVGNDFYYYYQSNGWMVGKNPMKDWKCAVRRWALKNKKIANNSDVILHNNNTGKFKKDDLW